MEDLSYKTFCELSLDLRTELRESLVMTERLKVGGFI